MFERRLHILLAGLGFFFVILGIRFFYLQIIRGEYYYSTVRENRRQIHFFKGERGRILDRNGQVLARNRQTKDVAIVMAKITQRSGGYLRYDMTNALRLVANLSQILGKRETEIWTRLEAVFMKVERKPFVFKGETVHDAIVLFEDVGDAIATEIEINRFAGIVEGGAVRLEDRFPGVEITTTQMRIYPHGEEVCHIVGYTGVMSEEEKRQFFREDIHETDRIGKCGVERCYEANLHGFPGKMMVDKVIKDKRIMYDILQVEIPESGDNLYLTIDVRLQAIIRENLRRFEANRGFPVRAACVMLNPQNGQVLAMVSYPAYDINAFIPRISADDYERILNDPGKPLINRCVRGYPPGSTYKPVLSIAASDQQVSIGKVTCMGALTLGSGRGAATFKCWKLLGHGEIDQEGALRESCNVYFYELGRKLGVDVMHRYADLFGFGEPTGIDLCREPEAEFGGINPSPAWKSARKLGPWVPGDTLNTSIGQGLVSASPLQVAVFTGMIGTSGRKVRPHILMGRYDAYVGEREQVLDQSSYLLTQRGMHQVTSDPRGTGYAAFKSLQMLGIDSAGKTGSAEVGAGKKTHSWYCGYCPYRDPVLAYSLVIENAGHGSDAAVPVMADILREIYEDEALRTSLGLVKTEYIAPDDRPHDLDEEYRNVFPEREEEVPEEVPVIID